MKRMRFFIISLVVVSILLCIGRATNTIDFVQEFKNKVQSATETVTGAAGYVKEKILSTTIIPLIASREKAIIENPYKNQVAFVRRGNQLHSAEQEYRKQRAPKVKKALEQLFGKPLDGHYVPTIALVCSGGGVRAALGTIGALCAMEKMGLLDALTYICTLSGSTWSVGTWYAYGTAFEKMPIEHLRNYFSERITRTIYRFDRQGAKSAADMLAVKIAFNQPITLVDVFGGLLANRFFGMYGDDRQMVYLSKQAQLIKDGSLPCPIYTAVDGSEEVAYIPAARAEKDARNSRLYEFTPYEVGSAAFQIYIPTWSYGRTFEKGKSIDYAPEQSFGYTIATCGSAFAAHVDLMWDNLEANLSDSFLKSIIESYVIKPLAGKRASYAEVFNFMRGIVDIPHAYNGLSEKETVTLVDGGLAFNLPYAPISGERPERKADIIIFVDMSAGKVAAELKKVEFYARDKNVSFPAIDYVGIDKITMSVFKNANDPNAPVVVYVPCITDHQLLEEKLSKSELSKYAHLRNFDMQKCMNEGNCGTLNFEYPQEQSAKIMDQMEFNMIVNKYKIEEVINSVIAAH